MIESRVHERIAVVTGASSGIGEAAALLLSAAGFHLVLIARRLDRLEKLQSKLRKSGGAADIICSDLSQEETYSAIADQVKDIGSPIEILLNNAGFGWYRFGDEMPWSVARSMLAVNVQAVTGLTLQFLPEMKRNDRGHIINVGSIVASIPSQGVAIYGATKAFLDGFTTSLYRELVNTGVHVSVVRTGAVKTPFFKKVVSQPGSGVIPLQRLAVHPETVAQRIIGLINRPRRAIYVPRLLWVVPWIEMYFGWLIDRLGPRLLRSSRF
ncbi:MAG: SDR family NAD(P)-dependent oxidoreductase [Anaerolineales bacterium]|nr:SDR family NAD(P)-dependent oxidoreductase [Anaerolineales bacterium]